MLKVTADILDELERLGAEAYPYEGCGLLLGCAREDANVALALFPVPNAWPAIEERRARFRIHPDDMARAELAAAGRDLDVVGIYHSHPDHPPVASPRDLAWAAWPGYSYLITGIHRGKPALSRSWQLLADRSGFREEALLVEETVSTAAPAQDG